MRYSNDERVVMTLDAGGTKLDFCAVKGEREIIEPIRLPTSGDDLELFLATIIDSFRLVESRLSQRPVAISFSFPGPTDYRMGIIGELENLPAFQGGVALGPMLEDVFGIPVFINNDGDLFAYGEATSGLLPEINRRLEESGSSKRFGNLFGGTFGTGFGGGIVYQGKMFHGDNSAQGEINRMQNCLYRDMSVEESVSIRGVRRIYAREAGVDIDDSPSTKEIYEIGMSIKEGNKEAAIVAFDELAIVAADAFINTVTLIDGPVVIGGGISGAHPLFLPRLIDNMNSSFKTFGGDSVKRLEVEVYNLEDDGEYKDFIRGNVRQITVPVSGRTITYDPVMRIGVGITRLGTRRAVFIGAYNFALSILDKWT